MNVTCNSLGTSSYACNQKYVLPQGSVPDLSVVRVLDSSFLEFYRYK